MKDGVNIKDTALWQKAASIDRLIFHLHCYSEVVGKSVSKMDIAVL